MNNRLLRKNVIANYVGRILQALLTVALTPFYLKLLGVEAFGLVAFFNSLLILSLIFDFGFSTTLNRELARLLSTEELKGKIRNLFRVIELVYWVFAILAGAALFYLSPLIAKHWFHGTDFSIMQLERVIVLMGITIAFQLPFYLYYGGLNGLQKQILYNGVYISMGLIRGVGSLIVLQFFSCTIEAFFYWQLLASLLQTAVMAFCLWSSLPSSATGFKYDWDELRQISKFAVGVSSISITTILLMQADKIVLSKILSLEHFGYYCLGATVANGMFCLISPLLIAYLPRFTELISSNQQDALIRLYHWASQLMALAMLPAACIIGFFSMDVIHLWTGQYIKETAQVAAVLTFGTALYGILSTPINLQLAFGWTRLAFYQSVIGTLFLVSFVLLTTPFFGVFGAAWGWALVNFGCILVGVHMMHHKILKTEKLPWYFKDNLMPLMGALVIPLFFKYFLIPRFNLTFSLLLIIIMGILSVFFTAWCTPLTRRWLRDKLKSRLQLGRAQ